MPIGSIASKESEAAARQGSPPNGYGESLPMFGGAARWGWNGVSIENAGCCFHSRPFRPGEQKNRNEIHEGNDRQERPPSAEPNAIENAYRSRKIEAHEAQIDKEKQPMPI
jgi:hypothetical protein